ncbi:hypothetical protein I317_01949 [Kwoniella heveanensis CBS 569]|nr:hypothetical protein I317_01949 [Kwoniella heveanensis CBS 569]
MPPKQKPPCGNPMFLKWMEELRDAAREKNLKSGEGYAKACRSLQNCPVTYNRPRELVVLQHIGEKTVAILEKKWKAWAEENGLVEDSPIRAKNKGKARASDPDEEDGDLSPTESASLATKPKKARKPAKPKTYIPAQGSGSYGILLSLVLAIEQPEINTQVFLTKTEVIRGAQEYCDSSYEHSEKGTHFTAWSGMKTLVNKGYVYVTGNPHKYCLTEEGYEVGVAMRNLRPEFANMVKRPFLDTPAIGTSSGARLAVQPSLANDHQPSSDNPTALSKQPSPRKRMSGGRPERFQFWYIDSAGNRVSSLKSAMIRLDPSEFINLRKLEFRLSQHTHPFASQLRLVDHPSQAHQRDKSGQATLFAFIVEEEAPPTCSKFDDEVGSETDGAEGSGHVNAAKKRTFNAAQLDDNGNSDDNDGEDVRSLQAEEHITKAAKVIPPFPLDEPHQLALPSSPFSRTKSAPESGLSRSPISVLAADAALRRAGQPTAMASRSHSAAVLEMGSIKSKPSRPAPRLSSHVPSPIPQFNDHNDDGVAPLHSTSNLPDFEPSRAITYPPGSYEIVLIVDTREVESRSNRDRIAETLEAKGIKVETRALRLGDMCWIARRTVGDLGGEEDECVLDYVVERKRLDDLCSSIRDGRYNEQCFRLSNSCINNIYYIVEDWQVAERMEYHGLQIMTAKSQIQVHNRFFLKETHRLSETIDFLGTMTRVIQSSLQGKSIRMIPTRYLSRSTYAPLQASLRLLHPDQSYLISFQAYQELNDKSASQTLREKFARMLLCVKGMSAERVSAILDVWETPRGLWESMKEHDLSFAQGQAEADANDNRGAAAVAAAAGGKKKQKKGGKDSFFADKVQGEGRRKIGDALSKELWKAFMGEESKEAA